MALETDWELDLSPYRCIYISYGSMDFQNRARIREGEMIKTKQNFPYFIRDSDLYAPTICISIDDYPTYKIKVKKDYTFVQIPSKNIHDIRPITEKLVSLLDNSHFTYLYICNFIKFVEHESTGHRELELEGNNIVHYLGKYVTHFYHWLGYSYMDIPFGLSDWIFKHDCIKTHMHIKLQSNRDFIRALSRGRPELEELLYHMKKTANWIDWSCFINIGKSITSEEREELWARERIHAGTRRKRRRSIKLKRKDL